LFCASDEIKLRLLFAASRFLFTRSGFRRFMTRAAFAVFRCVFFGVVHRLLSIGGTTMYIGRKEILFKKMFGIKKSTKHPCRYRCGDTIHVEKNNRNISENKFRKCIVASVQQQQIPTEIFSACYLLFKLSKYATP
jgi:hypothetical protein